MHPLCGVCIETRLWHGGMIKISPPQPPTPLCTYSHPNLHFSRILTILTRNLRLQLLYHLSFLMAGNSTSTAPRKLRRTANAYKLPSKYSRTSNLSNLYIGVLHAGIARSNAPGKNHVPIARDDSYHVGLWNLATRLW